MKKPICVLTIAGADSGGGAGVLADSRTIAATGAHPVMAITAVTAQNLHGVRTWDAMPHKLIEAQIEALWEDFDIQAIKTGLLPGPEAIRAVARAIGRHRMRAPLVVDPVMGATTGARFLDAAGIAALKRDLMPLSALLTPNWPEAQALTGLQVRTADEAAAAAQRLVAEGWRAVLVKGGHGEGKVVTDVLVTMKGKEVRFSGRRILTENTHGTGCVLSAAIAAHLALGDPLPKAIARSRRSLRAALRGNRKLTWGGRGPVSS
jgi:hydroxymethylpyrimidine/phosphomethylpyrimidine kinase